MDEQVCRNCVFYLKHYALDKRKIFRVYCGYCTRSRHKRKQPGTKACALFQPGSGQEDAFVTKEYLSKELLQYVLSLELLPEIENRG